MKETGGGLARVEVEMFDHEAAKLGFNGKIGGDVWRTGAGRKR